MQESTPNILEYAKRPPARPRRPWALAGIAGTAIFAGAVVGATTNAVNGFISERYFVEVMGWGWVTNVWRASVMQGILEGSVVGLLFAVVLATAIGIVTRCRCDYATGLRWLFRMVLGIYGVWAVGGICGIALAAWQPEFFRGNFIGVPGGRAQMLRYAWVGGSIMGAEMGGFCVIAAGLVWFGISWNRILKRAAAAE